VYDNVVYLLLFTELKSQNRYKQDVHDHHVLLLTRHSMTDLIDDCGKSFLILHLY